MNPNGEDRYSWVQQVKTVDAVDKDDVMALDANEGWRLLHVGMGKGGQTTLTYGWGWPPAIECGCYTVCEQPDDCAKSPDFGGST